MTHPHLRVVPADGQLGPTANESEGIPRWCVRVLPAVGGVTVYVVGFGGNGVPFTSVIAEPVDVADAERYVNRKLIERMGAAEPSRPTPPLRFPGG